MIRLARALLEDSVARVVKWLVATGVLLAPFAARADEEQPKVWQQLFFPFPIVGAPPQLEQQVQVFESYFRGNKGSGDVVSAELAYILSPQVGVVVAVPFQVGFDGQTTGFGDTQLLLQGLAAGSIEHDYMISVGLEGTLPTGHADLGAGSAYVGLFAYAAKRFVHRVILEANVATLLPISNADAARQLLATGLFSVLLTPLRFAFPIYAQVECNATTYFAGASATAETVFVAPEIYVGPFKGVRAAAGVFFDVVGDDVHAQTYTLTLAFDIPNPYGY